MSPLGDEIARISEQHVLARRPYINRRGISVVANVGIVGGKKVYREVAMGPHVNATLRKDEWVKLDERVIESSRERLVIIDDLRAAGLTYSVGGLGTIISEWEASSEITDAEVTMDGETQAEQDRQEFTINGVPIPVIQKPFKIGERTLLASRTRGAALDVTTGIEAARSVARVSENMVFNGTTLGAVKSAANTYQIYGLTNFPGRALGTISDWSNPATTPETILTEILELIQTMETTHRKYGPFRLYIPGAYAFQFRRDLKANSDKTLEQRVLAIAQIQAIRVSDVLADGNVLLIQMTSDVIDLAVAADVTNIQWASPSGWTNYFQTFAAWAPRIKQDYDDRAGYIHATVGT
jgi:uncharacterized linocin/CFP29 family protein